MCATLLPTCVTEPRHKETMNKPRPRDILENDCHLQSVMAGRSRRDGLFPTDEAKRDVKSKHTV